MANNTDMQRDPEEPIDPKRRKLDLATSSGSESEATSAFAYMLFCTSAPARSKGARIESRVCVVSGDWCVA